MSQQRGKRRVVTGTVVSDAMDKTITVRQERMVKHPLYGKYVRRGSTFKAHDEKNVARVGDVVEIAACRPLSKTKSWRLVQVIRSSALPGDVPAGDAAEQA
jgi:small subunit ribosomal protein S17